MFTEGDVRELVVDAIRRTVKACGRFEGFADGAPHYWNIDQSEIVRAVISTPPDPHAHECEGRLCTVCAEWRARHNLVRHGGCAD